MPKSLRSFLDNFSPFCSFLITNAICALVGIKIGSIISKPFKYSLTSSNIESTVSPFSSSNASHLLITKINLSLDCFPVFFISLEISFNNSLSSSIPSCVAFITYNTTAFVSFIIERVNLSWFLFLELFGPGVSFKHNFILLLDTAGMFPSIQIVLTSSSALYVRRSSAPTTFLPYFSIYWSFLS